jgi:hypothetical protein
MQDLLSKIPEELRKLELKIYCSVKSKQPYEAALQKYVNLKLIQVASALHDVFESQTGTWHTTQVAALRAEALWWNNGTYGEKLLNSIANGDEFIRNLTPLKQEILKDEIQHMLKERQK